MKGAYSWTKVNLDYVLLAGGSGYAHSSIGSVFSSEKGDAIGYEYSWDKDIIKSVGRGYTIEYQD